MKWVLISVAFYLLSVFAPLYYVWGQDAAPLQLLLEAVKKLENSDQLILTLNADITSLQETIETLSNDKLQLQRNNGDLLRNNQRQQTELETASISLQRQREASDSRSQEYQQTIERLSNSYNDILKASQIKDQTIAALTEKSRMFFRWGILATAAAVLPWVIILLVKKIRK